MIRSLWSAASGMLAQQMNVDVIANNLANVNTPGFKKSRVEFQDMLYQNIRLPQTIGTGQDARTVGGLDVGLGVRPVATVRQFSQGNIEPTNNPTDMAIGGDGFFVISDGQQQLYTRAGNFSLDAQGYLVTPEGYKLTDTTGKSLRVDLGQTLAAKATSKVTVGGLLDTSTPLNPAVGSSFDMSFGVVNRQGGAEAVALTFTHETANTWSVTDGTSTATLTFDPTSGKVTGAGTLNVTFTPSFTGATAQTVAFDFSQLVIGADQSNLSIVSQDGNSAGRVTGFQLGEDGLITIAFSNGQTQAAGQVGLASFANPSGLLALGGNLYQKTGASGESQVGKPGSGRLGSLAQGALEISNVQVVEEMVNLIVAQRAYEINSKAVQSSDDMLGIANSLRR